ncbi:hypothetical protein ONZ45_g6559 [Pleurotus djamor]|nr:hypothetical protein ONZ45_g17666 [Pleurotus djamor]KAJ8516110.1 hypothetical protein ONZ45_g6559 [Pleurotus djamor]
MLIGVFLNTILYGLLVLQMFIYYQTYKKDATWIKYFVLYLFVIETMNTGFDIAMMYEPLILNWGSAVATTFFPKMLAAEPIVTASISTPIQIFIAWRILTISKSRIIPAIIVFFAIVSLGGATWTSVKLAMIKLFIRKPELHWCALLWLLSSAISDGLIAFTLVYTLYQRKTGFKETDNAINRIMRVTIQTGLVTNFVWDLALGKLYSNALLSTLNARAGWNNLANANASHNVLFGDTGASSTVVSENTFRFRNSRKSSANPQLVTTGVFELEPTDTSTFSVGKAASNADIHA